jgi:carboxypeptidase C (cathepsin A)
VPAADESSFSQPAGVGLSTIQGTNGYPAELTEASADFMATLKVILESILPQYASNSLYIAGESFGGQYVPYFAAEIVKAQKAESPHALLKTPLAGIILVNAIVDESWMAVGHYELFCTDNGHNLLRFNRLPVPAS